MMANALPTPYCGRFAPTPSGPLHLGSLLTALAGWLQARTASGRWLLRIDDLDQARCPSGADQIILQQLQVHGLHWDGTPRYQSDHLQAYIDALQALKRLSTVYCCACTRADFLRRARHGIDGPIYDGHCRKLGLSDTHGALRFAMPPGPACIATYPSGQRCADAERELGDFVLLRSDGVVGYQLASAVDEQAQGITEVVRGTDLLASSLRQSVLLDCLGAVKPRYLHLPVLCTPDLRKLSKQNHAAALDCSTPARNLVRCLGWLGQKPPPALAQAATQEVLGWALAHWQPRAIPDCGSLQVE